MPRLNRLPALCALSALPLFAASGADPAVIRGEVIGGPVTPVSIDVDLRDLPRIPAWKPGDPVREVPRRTYPARPDLDAALPVADGPVDPLIAVQAAVPAPEFPSAFNAPVQNFAGQGYGAVNPPDTVGDVGASHYIQAVNASTSTPFTIYSKTGTLLAGPTGMHTLAPAASPCATPAGDPIVLYDRLADRWFIQEFAGSGNHLCIYVSKTANPVSGGWWFYDVTTPDFPDYPHFGVWPDAYYATTNETNPTIYALDRVNMLAGATARAPQRFTVGSLSNYTFQVLTPATFHGPMSPPTGVSAILMRHNDDEAHGGGSPNDFLDLWALHVDWTAPANSALAALPQITVADYNSKLLNYTTFNAVNQPGSSTKLDPLREVIMNNLVYRNFGDHEALLGNFVTNLNNSLSNNATVQTAVRWFELRRVGAGAWTLFQQGTYLGTQGQTLGTDNRWMGGIAFDSTGDIALSYSKTNTAASPNTVYPSFYYTGRLAADAAGTMTQGENLIAAGAAANGSGRWGDYAAMGVDPADDCTLWTTSMYSPTSQWTTKIAAMKFPGCTCQLMGMTVGTLALAKAGGNLNASWGATNNTLGTYRVYRSASANPAWNNVATGLTAANWSDAGQLGNATSQFYTVTAANPCGAETAR